MNLGTPARRSSRRSSSTRSSSRCSCRSRCAACATGPSARGAAAAQPADLRTRRADRPVHRDQAHRPPRPQRARSVTAAAGQRGHYTIFLGMAAGVGKTYRMLQEGHAGLEAGRDVVIGLLETHGAPTRRRSPRVSSRCRGGASPTAARRSRSSTCPPSCAALPTSCLIDELAHTDAPGFEHTKRYEDIEDVLDAGIDVLSTVNVQHLESLNDQIAELSGVRMRETVPDTVLGRADEVVLIDLPPEALIERLRAGKIYPQERIEAALNGFFRIENLAGAARGRAAPGGRGGRGQAADDRGGRLARREHAGRRRPGRRRAAAGARRALSRLPAPGAPRVAVGRASRRRARPAVGPARPAASPTRRRSARWPRCASSRRCSARGCRSRSPTTSRPRSPQIAGARQHLHPDRSLAAGPRAGAAAHAAAPAADGGAPRCRRADRRRPLAAGARGHDE